MYGNSSLSTNVVVTSVGSGSISAVEIADIVARVTTKIDWSDRYTESATLRFNDSGKVFVLANVYDWYSALYLSSKSTDDDALMDLVCSWIDEDGNQETPDLLEQMKEFDSDRPLSGKLFPWINH